MVATLILTGVLVVNMGLILFSGSEAISGTLLLIDCVVACLMPTYGLCKSICTIERKRQRKKINYSVAQHVRWLIPGYNLALAAKALGQRYYVAYHAVGIGFAGLLAFRFFVLIFVNGIADLAVISIWLVLVGFFLLYMANAFFGLQLAMLCETSPLVKVWCVLVPPVGHYWVAGAYEKSIRDMEREIC